jgi:hypothetical protein
MEQWINQNNFLKDRNVVAVSPPEHTATHMVFTSPSSSCSNGIPQPHHQESIHTPSSATAGDTLT